MLWSRLGDRGLPIASAAALPTLVLVVGWLGAVHTDGSALVGSRGALAAEVVVSCVLLLAGRRRPVLVLAGVLAVVVVTWVAAGTSRSMAWVAPLSAALYLSARYGGRSGLLCSAGLGVGAVLLFEYLDPTQGLQGNWGWALDFLAVTAVGGWFGLRDLLTERERSRDVERARAALAEERVRVAREVHDLLAHSLGVVVVQADVADQLLEVDPAGARSALAAVRATGRSAMAETGRLVAALRGRHDPADPSAGWPLQDIDELVDRMRGAGLPVAYRRLAALDAVAPQVGRAAYRVVQESLTNVLRHAGPAPTTVGLQDHGGALVVHVTNDGPPLDVAGPGYGLIGMAERVHSLGGQLRAGPRPEGGFEVYAELPPARP